VTYSVAFGALEGILVVVTADAHWSTFVYVVRAKTDRTSAVGTSETVFVKYLRLDPNRFLTFRSHQGKKLDLKSF